MKKYKLTFELKSPLITPIQGDTLFGHICWGIAYNHGEAELLSFLDSYSTKPPLVISDGFPYGFLPKPILKQYFSDKEPNLEELSLIKKLKKLKYIPEKMFEKPLSQIELSKYVLENKSQANISIFFGRMHNSINRISGTAEQVFEVKETYFSYSKFQVIVFSTYEKSKVKQLFEQGLENGYGADKFTGKGEVSNIDIEDFTLNVKGNRSMALSSFVVESASSLNNFRYDLKTKFGKLGGHFVTTKNPFKKPIVMYQRGSTFDCIDTEFVGTLLGNVHKETKIKHHCFAPVISFSEDENE